MIIKGLDRTLLIRGVVIHLSSKTFRKFSQSREVSSVIDVLLCCVE